MSNTKEPLLSSFYFINGELYGNTIKVTDGEKNHDYIINKVLHRVFWPSIKELNHEFANKDFKYYPRGRVRYNIETDKYEVFIDRKIMDSEKAKSIILKKLKLPKSKTIFIIDINYESVSDLLDNCF